MGKSACRLHVGGDPGLTSPSRSKAVANGAVGFILEQYVKERISKYTYGTCVERHFNPQNMEHIRRQPSAYIDFFGNRIVRGGFTSILAKVYTVPDKFGFITNSALGHSGHRQVNLRSEFHL